MIIRMIETRRGSDDGFIVRRYEKSSCLIVGKEIGENLARAFISRGWAKEITK